MVTVKKILKNYDGLEKELESKSEEADGKINYLFNVWYYEKSNTAAGTFRIVTDDTGIIENAILDFYSMRPISLNTNPNLKKLAKKVLEENQQEENAS